MRFSYIVKTAKPEFEDVFLYLSYCKSFFRNTDPHLTLDLFNINKVCRYDRKQDALFDIERYIRDNEEAKITDFHIVEVEISEGQEESAMPHTINFNCNAYGWDYKDIKKEEVKKALYERYHIKVKDFEYKVMQNAFDQHMLVQVLSQTIKMEED